MAKQIIYGEEARSKLKAGVDAIARAVVTTLGPKGRNVSIERPWTHPHVVHDGVTVAREIELADPFENQGAQMVKEASSKTNDVAGDGTTTSMVIAQAVVEEGLKNVTAGANPMLLKTGIEAAVKFVNEQLLAMATKIESKAEMANVAHISSASEEIGNLVADAMEKVGKDGTITAEESPTVVDTYSEFKEGMEIKAGWISPHFVTNGERMEAEIKDCYILITDRTISSPNEMLRFLEGLVGTHKISNIAVIAASVEGPALAMLVVNKLKGIIKSVAIKAPRGGDRMRDILEDLAVLTGGKVVSEDRGVELDNIEKSDLGFAKKIIATKDTTIILADKNPAVEERMTMLRHEIEDAKAPSIKERFQDRLAKLEGGVAVINVGASTEVEMKEKVERVKDAIGATKAALEEGIVAGGGVALVQVADALRRHIWDTYEGKPSDDIILGMQIVEKALYKPLWWIASNAGRKADHIIEKVREENLKIVNGNIGYNVYTDTYDDMIAVGVIDPVKVTRHAVLHGASCAMMVLTTECLICDIPEKKSENEA